MRFLAVLLLLIPLSAGALLATAKEPQPKKKDQPAEEVLSLFGMLGEWQYPDSKLHGSATLGDGGVIGIQSIKCHAVVTTPDSVDAVRRYYEDKLANRNEGAAGDNRRTDGKAVDFLDDSAERPLQLHVVTVNEEDRSTTLVISRGEGESLTHIAWSHFRRLGKP